MKKLILLASLAFSINAFAQVPSYVPSNGLVGWWPFNGNANDQSGNALDGTVNGTTLTTDRFGNTNSAYSFNGTTNYINVSYNSSFNMQKSTWSFWVKPSATAPANGNYILGYSDNASHHISNITVGDSSYSQIGWTSGGAVQNGTGHLSNGTWHMITITYDQTLSANNFTYYFDGIQKNTVTVQPFTFNTNSQLRFGLPANGLQFQPFNGSEDDLGIWSRILTQQEITNLYNANICYQSVTVTDTLLINTTITGFNPVTYQNTIKVWPNPSNDHITIDNGNIANLAGYQIKITNSLGQQVFQSNITQQQFYVDLSTWTGNGIYFVHIIDGQGNTIDIKKIVLQ